MHTPTAPRAQHRRETRRRFAICGALAIAFAVPGFAAIAQAASAIVAPYAGAGPASLRRVGAIAMLAPIARQEIRGSRTECGGAPMRVAWGGRGPGRPASCATDRVARRSSRPAGYGAGKAPYPLPDEPLGPVAHRSNASGASLIEAHASERNGQRRPSDSQAALGASRRGQSLAFTSSSAARSVQVAARAALFHEAHAPPVRS